jgi:hypothetical protein
MEDRCREYLRVQRDQWIDRREVTRAFSEQAWRQVKLLIVPIRIDGQWFLM